MNQTIKILPGQRFSRKVIQKTFILLIISWLISGLMIKAQGQIFGKNLPTLKSLHLNGWISSFRMTSYAAIISQGTPKKGEISPDKEVGTPITDYIFNTAGKLLIQRNYSKDTALLSESFFEYNNSQVTLSQGNHKEWFKLNPRGQLLQKIENSGLISNYAYDSLGKRRDVQLFFQDSVHPVGEFKYLYDDKGMLTEIKSLDKGKPGFHYASMKYKYDNKGNIIQESNFYPNNKLAYSDFYTYDDKNNIESRSRSYLDSDSLHGAREQKNSAYNRTYSYDYDAKGNWVRRIDYYNNTPLFVVERAINYGRLDKDFIVNGYASEQEAPDQYSSQKEAQFPGGIMAWQQFLVKNLKTDIPKLNGAPAGQYSIVISFLINKDGTVTEAKCVSAPHPDFGCIEEALRVIRLSPSWIPAEKNGQKVFYREKQRINFRVDRQVKSDQ